MAKGKLPVCCTSATCRLYRGYASCRCFSPAATACSDPVTTTTPLPPYAPNSCRALSKAAPSPAWIISRHLKGLPCESMAAACQCAAKVPTKCNTAENTDIANFVVGRIRSNVQCTASKGFARGVHGCGLPVCCQGACKHSTMQHSTAKCSTMRHSMP